MQSKFTIDENSEGQRLDLFLQSKLLNFTRSHIKKMIDDGLVKYNDKVVKSGQRVQAGGVVEATIEEPKMLSIEPENIDIQIVYEDDDLAVINKSRGMVVHPANGNYDGTLVNALLYHLKNLSGINGVIRPGIVHRLDKDTSGLLIIAKNDKAHLSLSKQIEKKDCHRYYLAICEGNFKNDDGTITTGFGRSVKDRKQMSVYPIGQGKLAVTHYKVLERFGKYTLVEFKLDTGRTHQIRVHSKHLGHPIVCDPVYGVKNKEFKNDGQLLHAYKLEFTQPSTNEKKVVECDLPKDFSNILQTIRKKYGNYNG